MSVDSFDEKPMGVSGDTNAFIHGKGVGSELHPKYMVDIDQNFQDTPIR